MENRSQRRENGHHRSSDAPPRAATSWPVAGTSPPPPIFETASLFRPEFDAPPPGFCRGEEDEETVKRSAPISHPRALTRLPKGRRVGHLAASIFSRGKALFAWPEMIFVSFFEFFDI